MDFILLWHDKIHLLSLRYIIHILKFININSIYNYVTCIIKKVKKYDKETKENNIVDLIIVLIIHDNELKLCSRYNDKFSHKF